MGAPEGLRQISLFQMVTTGNTKMGDAVELLIIGIHRFKARGKELSQLLVSWQLTASI